LTEASLPFITAGECIGNLIVGQVFLKEPDTDLFVRQAENYGFDREDYISAIKEVPVVDETEFRFIMDYFSELMPLLGDMAFQAYKYKELSDRLMIRTEELEYVNNELESFSYSVSHDLRAPLRHIMGFIELFNKKYSGSIPDQGKHYFDVIYSSTKNMSVLIDELLKFCRNGRAEITKADVDMDEVVKELLMSIKEDAGDRSICWNVDRLAPARCDKEMFKLVWQNLIENAVKFTGKKPEAVIEIGCCEENGRPVYFIKDNGAGFDMRYSQKLFGVFQRMHSKDEFDGTGIGLATAKRIISRHGGKIWAEAATDKGAAFYFNIPGEGETQKDEF
jgi:light-regulated signal transduction histidine kinase (bacteriophytochrome)